MGLLRKLTKNAGRAKILAEKNAGKIAEGVNKATDKVDDKTKGKYTDKLAKVDKAAKDFADKSDGGKSDGGKSDGGNRSATDDDGNATPPTQV